MFFFFGRGLALLDASGGSIEPFHLEGEARGRTLKGTDGGEVQLGWTDSTFIGFLNKGRAKVAYPRKDWNCLRSERPR